MVTQKKITFVAVASAAILFGVQLASADDPAFEKNMDSYLAKEANIEKVAKALETHFTKKRAEQEKTQGEDEAKEMEKQFTNPVKIDIGSSPVRGPKDAKITIIEFSDFQCPFCQRGAQTMDDLLKAYPTDVKVAFKNLPLPFHPQAKPAAVAALAAGEQGKFWEMHDELFKNQQNLSEEFFNQTATKLGLDMAKFAADLKNEKLTKQIDDDMQIANTLGVRGTPGFFVNGVQVRGAREPEYFKQIIDRWLKKK